MEAAATEGDEKAMEHEHERMIAFYEKIVTAIFSTGFADEKESDEGKKEEDVEIMEFLPE